MKIKKLSEIAKIDISGVDKKTNPGEKSVKLCNFTDVYYNWSVSNSDVPNFMDASAKDTEIERFSLKKGYVAITKDSETRDDIGISCLITENLENTILGYHCALIIPNEDIVDGGYLNACLQTKMSRTYFSNQASGSGQRYTLSVNGIGCVKVPIIPLEEQKKIANLLDLIDRKIRVNNTINDNLQQLIDTIYSQWFESFNFPNTNGKPYKQFGGEMIKVPQFKYEIPANFKVVSFLDVCFWETNSQPPKSQFIYEQKDGYVRFIQNRDYDSDSYKTYIPITKSLSIVDELDILMDKYGDAGKVRYGINGAFNVALAKIGVNKSNTKEYIRSYLSSKAIYTFLHNSCMASTRASLNEDNLKALFVAMPPDYLLDQFENKVHKIRCKILENDKENRQLKSMRDELLPLLMNGQVTIQD